MIAVAHLTRIFGERVAVRDVTLEVSRGEIVALLGPNGAGKTTTMRMLAGLIEPTGGTVTIDGVGLTRATGTALRARIGFLTESPGLWDRLTVRENLDIYARLYGIDDRERAIEPAEVVRGQLGDHERRMRPADLAVCRAHGKIVHIRPHRIGSHTEFLRGLVLAVDPHGRIPERFRACPSQPAKAANAISSP